MVMMSKAVNVENYWSAILIKLCTYEPLMKLLYSYCVNRHQMIKSNKSDRYYER